MKINTKVVIDIKTSEILEEESYDYDGQVTWCGGSSGGGGGGSGQVDYPAYMKDVHANWIKGSPIGSGGEELDRSQALTSVLKDQINNSPFSGKSAYDPSSNVSGMKSAISSFRSYLDELNTESKICDEISAYNSGKDNICASVGGSFDRGHQVLAAGMKEPKLQAEFGISKLETEVNRMSIAAYKQQTDTDRKIKQKNSLWALEIYQSGGNILGSISGGTLERPTEETPSDTQKAMAGALSGAGTGAMIGSAVPGFGPAVGAGVGAVVGAGASLL